MRQALRGVWGDRVFNGLTLLAGLFIVALALVMAYVLFTNAQLSIEHFGWRFLTTSSWDAVHGQFGALPLIYGTVVSSLLALLMALPLGLGSAIFLGELAPGWLRTPVSFCLELLAAIPSIVYGIWGLFVLAPLMRQTVQPWLAEHLGFLPFFQGPIYGVGVLTAGIILAIMILPTIAALSRDVLRVVPQHQREALLALGATRWETIRLAVLPYGRNGLLGAVILALGRALGETMAVTTVIGNRPEISSSLFSLGQTMASMIANDFGEAGNALHSSALMEVALVLFGLTFILNALARLLVWSVGRGPKGEVVR